MVFSEQLLCVYYGVNEQRASLSASYILIWEDSVNLYIDFGLSDIVVGVQKAD